MILFILCFWLQVFFMIPLLVELKAVPAVKAIVTSQLAIAENTELDLEANLNIIKTCIEEMTSQLSYIFIQRMLLITICIFSRGDA